MGRLEFVTGLSYDGIGRAYSARRRNRRLEAAIWEARGDARTVLNVGAAGMLALDADLASGRWQDQHREQLGLTELHLGYYLAVAESR
jgi:hypothetical protein